MEGREKLRKGFGLTNKKHLLSQVLFWHLTHRPPELRRAVKFAKQLIP